MIGNFIADFVRNKDLARYEAGVVEGVYLHRKIDHYTDNHPIVRQGSHRLRARHGKYAPVLIDLFYDYLLVQHWNQYSSLPLQQFVDQTYQTLERNIHLMPTKLQQILPHWIADNWLPGYGTDDGLAFAIHRMKRRVSKPDLLNDPIVSLKENFEALDIEFQQFFPEVQAFVKAACGC